MMIMKSPGHCLDFVTASSLLNLLQCISGSRFCSAPRKGHISFSSPKLASRLRFHVTLEQGRLYIVSHFKDFLPVPMPHSRTLSSCLFIHRSCAVVLLVRCSRKWLYPLRSKTLSCSNSKASVISSAWVLFPLRGSSAFWYQMSCQYFQLNTSLVKLLIRLSVRLCPPDCANGTRMSHINFFSCTSWELQFPSSLPNRPMLILIVFIVYIFISVLIIWCSWSLTQMADLLSDQSA